MGTGLREPYVLIPGYISNILATARFPKNFGAIA
jgi:hypothetical protein